MMNLNENFILRDKNLSNAGDTLNLARHRWYYYKEGFSPNLVKNAIDRLQLKADDIIVDPFNGSGTVTLSSALNGNSSIGVEVNPFTAFVSRTKVSVVDVDVFDKARESVLNSTNDKKSKLLNFSTFSENEKNKKWLFNKNVLNAFESAYQTSKSFNNKEVKDLVKLILITSAMENSNVRRDGKCLRYKNGWQDLSYDTNSFYKSLEKKFSLVREDLSVINPDMQNPTIYCDDSRKYFSSSDENKFSLCITSPPYLNTFDYTDIYRPELFLGEFVTSMKELYNLRLRTIRSHIQAKWDEPVKNEFGILYEVAIKEILSKKELLMNPNIPIMIQAYFEDMEIILKGLKNKAKENAELWLIVSTSAYANVEIPVDLIIGEIGNRIGWQLKEIGVLRNIRKRKTKYSPDIATLRESVVIFKNSKK